MTYDSVVAADFPSIRWPGSYVPASSSGGVRPVLDSASHLFQLNIVYPSFVDYANIGSPDYVTGIAFKDGSSSGIEFPDSSPAYGFAWWDSPGTVSLEIWIYLFSDTSSNWMVFGIDNSDSTGNARGVGGGGTTGPSSFALALAIVGGSPLFSVNGVNLNAGVTLSTGAWHHIVGTVNATTGDQKIYTDGALRATHTGTTSPGTTTLALVLNATAFEQTAPHVAWAKPAVYSAELSSTQVLNHFNAAAAPAATVVDFDTDIVMVDGAYGDGVIWKGSGGVFPPDFRLVDLYFDPTVTYTITYTYSGGIHDALGRSAKVDSTPQANPTDFTDYTGYRLYNNTISFTGYSATFTVGPGLVNWDTNVPSPNLRTVPNFTGDINGALSNLVISPALLDAPYVPTLPEDDVTGSLAGSGVIALESDQIDIVPEFQIAVLDTTIRQAPSSITVTVDGGRPDTEIQFFLDLDPSGQDLAYTATLDLSGHLEPTSITITGALGGEQGTRTVSAFQVASDGVTMIASSATYTVQLIPNPSLTSIGVDAQAVTIPGSVIDGVQHWVLQDLLGEGDGGIGSYVLPINPTSMESPHLEFALKTHHTTSQDGVFHVFQAGNIPKEWTFTGVADTQEFVEELLQYRGLNRRIYIIDHHNRAWKAVILNVDIVPRLRTNWKGEVTDWFTDYTVSAVIVDQAWGTPS